MMTSAREEHGQSTRKGRAKGTSSIWQEQGKVLLTRDCQPRDMPGPRVCNALVTPLTSGHDKSMEHDKGMETTW
jgi:hypothetical protein